MGYGLAIGRSLQAVPRTTGVRWVGQAQREIRASSPSFPSEIHAATHLVVVALRNKTEILQFGFPNRELF